MTYHLFWKTTHYICENYYSAIRLRHTLGGGLVISDNSPKLQDIIEVYRRMF